MSARCGFWNRPILGFPSRFAFFPAQSKPSAARPRADFVVDAALVSRLHCRFTLDDRDRLDVEDLGSTNGTWVNGRKVARAPLLAGDKMKIGRVEFAVKARVRRGQRA